MKKYHQIAEIVWFAVGLITLVLSILIIIRSGWDGGKYFLLAPIISFLMFITRRFIRKKLENETFKQAEEQKQARKKNKQSNKASSKPEA
jgi:phosphotransferase system  glucose/maltose/N-acetylglucosamine-specific IIC component